MVKVMYEEELTRCSTKATGLRQSGLQRCAAESRSSHHSLHSGRSVGTPSMKTFPAPHMMQENQTAFARVVAKA